MNPLGNYEQPPEVRRVAPRLRGQRIPAPNPQLFEDTSMQQSSYPYTTSNFDYGNTSPPAFSQQAGYNLNVTSQYAGNSGQPGAGIMFPGQQFMSDPVVANMAVQYGRVLAGHGTELVHENIEKYVSTSKLKHYFAVDTTYVGKKLGLLLFPYVHSDWSSQYNSEEPVVPRANVNAPDLYIPGEFNRLSSGFTTDNDSVFIGVSSLSNTVKFMPFWHCPGRCKIFLLMAFVTYVLLAGVVLGTQSRFSPEQLGIIASTALIWTVIEILALLFSMYIMNITSALKLLDFFSYCGYKYIGMIVILVASLAFSTTGYYIALAWMSLSLGFFLTETDGYRRRLYTLIVIAVAQPLLMWWLTWRLVPSD